MANGQGRRSRSGGGCARSSWLSRKRTQAHEQESSNHGGHGGQRACTGEGEAKADQLSGGRTLSAGWAGAGMVAEIEECLRHSLERLCRRLAPAANCGG